MRTTIAVMLCFASIASAQDGDGDGVIDRRDRCRFTPTGATVDPAGCSSECDAQIVGTDAFARTILTEIGVSGRGTFGTDGAAPGGYHARPAGRLGFVANPERSGWTTYDGDFFLPGSPEEGFGLTVGGLNRNNNNNPAIADVPGAVMSAVCVPSGLCGARGGARIVWRGTDSSGIAVEQEAVILDEGVFIILNVALTNTSGAEMVDVYYLRNVDPDNNQSIFGSFTTRNTIVSQVPPLGTSIQSLVAAEQDTVVSPTITNDSYVALVSRQPSAVAAYGGFSNRSASDVYMGIIPDPHSITVGGSDTNDIAISIAFRFPSIGAGETVRFTYLYVLGESAVDDALLCAAEDSDFDGVPDADDVDDDNDGVTDALEVSGFPGDPGDDTDGDGVPDWRDPDLLTCTDTASPRGVCDAPPASIDRDGDTVPDHLDLDSDADGITDCFESAGVDNDADGRPDGCSSFGTDGACRDGGGTLLLAASPPNTDGADEIDLRDTDSDNDGLDDRIEAHDDDGDGAIDLAPSGADRDEDGIDDAYDIDCVGMPAGCAAMGRGVLVPLSAAADADADGLGDWLETCGDAYVRGGEICDTGALRETCSASCRRIAMQPCVDDMECDTTLCNGTTMTCEPCTEAGAVDRGCTPELPVCVVTGPSVSCEACQDSAPGGAIDDGCTAALPFCDLASRTCTVCPEAVCPMPDGGMPDAGMLDGGVVDASAIDASAIDGGGMDGTVRPDGAISRGRPLGSGISCGVSRGASSIWALALALAVLALWRRRRTR